MDDKIIAWYDPATGGFYLSFGSIPDRPDIMERIIPLVRQPKFKIYKTEDGSVLIEYPENTAQVLSMTIE